MLRPVSDLITSLLGSDYVPGGRGPEYDCVGLALRLAVDCFGVVLPDPRLESPHALRAALRPVTGPPLPGDWVYNPKGNGHDGAHFAVVEDGRWAAEAHCQFGVRRLRLADALKGATIWRPRG